MLLHLVDGTYELFRAHFSKAPRRHDPDGRDVTATVGVAASLLRLLEDGDGGDDDAGRQPSTHVAIAFDRPIESFRNERFAGYKDGADVDPVLLAQLEDVEVAAAALGVTVWSMDRYEADDALATAATRFADEVDQVRVLTPDKDLAQVVTGDRVVQVDRSRGTVRDEAAVHERFGVSPASIPDLLALVGDTADGIPGLPGFGAKSAATLLAHYDHLDAIPTDATDWDVAVRGAARLAATLAERREDALLYRDLATLVLDVPLAAELDSVAWQGVPRERFTAWCDRFGVTTLRDRPTRWTA